MANWISLLDVIYPIGSLYFSTKSASPSSSVGGTWNQIKDKTLVGCGEDFIAGSIGGEIEHTLTTDEMPRHRHALPLYKSSWTDKTNRSYNAVMFGDYTNTGVRVYSASSGSVTQDQTSTGGGNRIPICRPTTQFISGKESLNIFYKKGRC